MLLCALSAVALMAPATAASAAEPAFYFGPADSGPSGATCGFTSLTDPGTETGEIQTGEVEGGPLLGDGTLSCILQVGSEAHEGTGNDAAGVSESGTDLVVVKPTVLSYVAPDDVPVFLCSMFTSTSGTKIYWNAATKEWSQDPASPCALAIRAGTDDPIFQSVNDVAIHTSEEAESSEGYARISATCTAGPGMWWNLDQATVLITTTATVQAPQGAQTIGTTVRCWLYQRPTGWESAAAEGGMPGGFAAAAALVDVEHKNLGHLIPCIEAWALFTGNYPPLHLRSEECPA